ncbi:MAG TPA: secretin N-terminal domain-containing protein [Chthoniobacteraceae bacterium]|nr:Type and secretion system protein [Chthoniobacter sp.]HEV7869308.1 secretin N-terminal domain-containing protein [Chthoniobacteraceae bacterium]
MPRSTSVLLALLLSGTAFAQFPNAAGPQTIAPPPRTAAVPSKVPGEEDLVPLQFPNSDVRDVLAFYERLTKKHLVIDNQVMGPLNIVLSQLVPVDDAIKIIEINLLLNGFSLVPVENSNIVKVISSGRGGPRSAAIPIITDELLIPEGEHVITFLAKVRYVDPQELASILGTFVVAAPGNYTNITPLPKSGALLITENSATIRQILRVIQEVDIPPAEVLSKFFELERADAEDVQKKLEDILTKQAQQPGAPGATVATRVAPAPRVLTNPDGSPLAAGAPPEQASTTIEVTGGGPNEESFIVGKIKITADKRTNRIHVVTRPENMPRVAQLIREFDANVKFGTPTARPLKFVSAKDVLDIAVKAISDPGAKEEGGAAGNQPGQGNRTAGNQGSLFNNNNNDGGGTFGSGGGSGGGEFNVSEGLSTEEVDTTPEARIVGNTRIIADKRANTIIVIGSEDIKEKLWKVIDQLDKRAPQVLFTVVIGELNMSDREQFGVDYIIRNAGLGSNPIVLNPGPDTPTVPGTPTTPGTGTGTTNNLASFNGNQPQLNLNNLLNQQTVTQIAAAGGGGLTGFITAGNTLTAVVTALENTNRFKVVSSPRIFTSNLRKAIIASGQEVAVPTNIQSGFNGGNAVGGNANLVTNSSVQFKRVALQLEVVPLINSDREVDLDILQKVDEISGSTRIDNNDIPTIATRYVRTHVRVPNQGTLVLGGLIKASTTRVRSGIPLLSSIPVLGYLFSNTTKERVRNELVILIRPEVSWSPEEDVMLREKTQEFYNIPPDLEATIYPTLRRSRTDPMPRIEIRRAQPVKQKTVTTETTTVRRLESDTRKQK